MIAYRAVRGIDRNKIVFSSFNARTYGDNLKPISEMLHEMRPQAKIVWMFRDPRGEEGARAGLCDFARSHLHCGAQGIRRRAGVGGQFHAAPAT